MSSSPHQEGVLTKDILQIEFQKCVRNIPLRVLYGIYSWVLKLDNGRKKLGIEEKSLTFVS
jgi:hypothetical protein